MEGIVSVIIGIVLIFIGILNRKGNISLLHSYHRKRVSEADILPFGKMIGLGTIIIGAGLIIGGGLSLVALYLGQEIYTYISYAVLGVGFVSGMGIIFYAMFKYNKGIF